jgi:hypothetical protein
MFPYGNILFGPDVNINKIDAFVSVLLSGTPATWPF